MPNASSTRLAALTQFEGHLADITDQSRGNKCNLFFDLLKSVYTLHAPPQYTYTTSLYSTQALGEQAQELDRSIVSPEENFMPVVPDDNDADEPDTLAVQFEEVSKPQIVNDYI